MQLLHDLKWREMVMDIITGLAGAKTALDILKGIKDFQDEVQKLEIGKAILALETALFEMDKENFELRKENEKLRKTQEFDLKFIKEMEYYSKKMPDGTLEGQYCSTCQDNEGKYIRLSIQGSKKDGWYCRVCKNSKSSSDSDIW